MSSKPASHFACSASNFLAQSLRHHNLDGPHLIDFPNKKGGDFPGWCEYIGADNIQFKRLEYRKGTGGFGHESIFLYDMRRDPDALSPLANSKVASHWESLESIEDRVCQVERMANPEAQVNALVCTDAADYITIFKKESSMEGEQLADTRVLLEITFSEWRTLEDVLDICYRISRHPKARHYTLQQFNCFFFSWNLILGLLRSEAGWDVAVVRQHEVVHRAVDGWLQEFAATEGTSNLALVISDVAVMQDPTGPSLGSHCSLTYALSNCFRGQPAIAKLRSAFSSAFWATEQEAAITGAIRHILLEVANETTNLAYDGTGETSLNRLFEREEPLDVPSEWKPDIETEGARLVGEFVNSLIWTHFGAALKHTDQNTTRDEARSRLSLTQRARYSEPALMARLSLLGCKTAWRNTNAISSVGVYGQKQNSFVRAARFLQHAPQQIRKVVEISRPFVSVVGAKLEESAAAGERIEIKGVGDNILNLAPDLNVDQAKLEDEVISQIEWSIGNLAKAHDGCDRKTLRMATLQLLAHLRNKGRELCFVVRPIELWQMCLWYAFADGMVNLVTKVAGGLCMGFEPKYQCKQAVTSSSQRHVILKRELTYSKIEGFIRGRIRHLSETAKKDALGLAEPCQQELERAMSEIWNDRVSWRDCLAN
ncbi:hypothetical protein FRC10_010270 [Ceratobasidium sp. 414]|nr:hypothetical protein FRC10_010270 [Ceratobasidium sp. 414]